MFGYIDDGTVKNLGVSGSVTSKSTYDVVVYVGGILGHETGGVPTSNCYYLESTAEDGSGSLFDSVDSVAVKTEAKFKSGEVAWLLRNG